MFKPNLIPNSDVANPIDLKTIIGDNVKDWVISFKKDGCRMEINSDMNASILSRSLEPVTSIWLNNRYKALAEKCKELGMILEGEIYAHGWRFQEIVRIFKTEDITTEKKVKELQGDLLKFNINGTVDKPVWTKVDIRVVSMYESRGYKSKFETNWPGRTVEFMSTYSEDIKLWPFDCFFPDFPQMEYKERMEKLFNSIINQEGELYQFKDILNINNWFNLEILVGDYSNLTPLYTWEHVEELYNYALIKGFEGLVLAKADRTYKMGRSTEKEATIFKMKEDKNEYDGIVLDILEGTVVKEGVERTTNELGQSVTSKLQEDREPSGMAKGILTEYEGHQHTVSFQGYSHEELKELLQNKEQYIGKWFKYQGMKPTRDCPRHAHFTEWRDSK